MSNPEIESAPKPPSFLLLLSEIRAVFEHGWFHSTRTLLPTRALLNQLPKGDGHPVLVLPGFMAGDPSTRPLRDVLIDLDYDARPWRLGRNMLVDDQREEAMHRRLEDIFHECGEKVSIVGWSLGGLFARELAKAAPEKVRSVISLGSPVSPDPGYSNARQIYARVNGDPKATAGGRLAAMSKAPPVPTTSIFSKTDGVVAWRASLQKSCSKNPHTENIEVHGSHFGLGVNPLVIYLVADRLAQADGEWAPFDDRGLKKMLFRRRHA